LEGVAKPDSTHIAWYTPDIHGNETDFLLFSTHAGMIVFEIKDWNLDQILEANPHQFSLRVGSKTERRKNPLQQAKDYQYDLMNRIKEDGQLISKDAVHLGKPKIPFSHGVVFTNINKHDYVQKGFDSIIGTDKASYPVPVFRKRCWKNLGRVFHSRSKARSLTISNSSSSPL
jgi:hypothetical protein